MVQGLGWGGKGGRWRVEGGGFRFWVYLRGLVQGLSGISGLSVQ